MRTITRFRRWWTTRHRCGSCARSLAHIDELDRAGAFDAAYVARATLTLHIREDHARVTDELAA